MKFGKEKAVKCWDMETTISKKEEDALLEYAKKNSVNDKQCLINWAINKGLENYIKDLKEKNTCLSKLISKKNKNKV